MGLDYQADDYCGTCYQIKTKDGTADLISLGRWTGDAFDNGELAHEALHAAIQILGRKGMKLTDESDEAYAYLTGSIVRRCLELIAGSKKSPCPRRKNRA